MRFILIFSLASLLLGSYAFSQSLKEVELDNRWKGTIEHLAPDETSFAFDEKKKVLVFSLHTGFKHWVIPHTEEMIKIVGAKSGAFEVTATKDISFFELEKLEQFDVIVLNNTCSKPDHRNLFWDELNQISEADSATLMQKAHELENNLIRYVESGGGLLVLHGAVTTQNNSMAFSRLVGGSFDYHPPQQEIQIRLEDPNHPLVQSFPAEGFTHVDEPYFYKNAYEELDFTPLLYFNNAEIKNQRKGKELTEGKTYAAWIRKAGDGRVMYCSPSHNAQSFENPNLLRFYLDGLQWLSGQVSFE
ncbi:ThuA domain-containing protein [Algoriphagus namhaensis]